MSPSQIAFQSHEPVANTPRRSMTPSRRQRVLERQEGRCGYPGCEATEGLEIDHTIALALGGKDADENCIGLCREHHAAKTRLDIKLISKAKRLQIKNGPKDARPKAQPIRSQGFKSRWPK